MTTKQIPPEELDEIDRFCESLTLPAVFAERARTDLPRLVTAYREQAAEVERLRGMIEQRRDYFLNKNLHNGWSGKESGPCCERCEMRDEFFDGRADALKAAVGCRNPFQLEAVCQCHLPVREAVRNGIVEAHNQLITTFTKKAARTGELERLRSKGPLKHTNKELCDALADQRRQLGKESDDLKYELERVRKVAFDEIETLRARVEEMEEREQQLDFERSQEIEG